jgi:hypothetical protein
MCSQFFEAQGFSEEKHIGDIEQTFIVRGPMVDLTGQWRLFGWVIDHNIICFIYVIVVKKTSVSKTTTAVIVNESAVKIGHGNQQSLLHS